MHELLTNLIGTLRAMWRRRWVGLLVAWLVAGIGAVALLRAHDRYEATARVYVDTKTVLKPLMRELAVEPDVDTTLLMLSRTLITRPNIELLMERLGTTTTAGRDREATIERFAREIKVASLGRDNVFSFSYRDTDPVQARVVVENLVSLFVESDLGSKRRDVDGARNFIDQQIRSYEARLTEAENRVKEFKLRNLGISDASGRDYFTRMSTLTDELNKMMLDLRAAEQSRDALRRELTSGESVSLVPNAPPPLASVSTPEIDSRLDAQRRQLDELLRRYTDLHPDVVSTRRLIARLEEQRAQEAEAKRRSEATKPRSTPETNAAVQQTKLALAESEATVAALKVRVGDTQARLGQLRTQAARAPQIEAELAQLNRDYEVVRRNYDALVAQREKASMSEEVDGTRLARFRIIDPPRTAPMPVFPNRLVLIPAVLLLAVGAGVAVSFLIVQVMPTVDSSQALRALTGRPVLGNVSMLVTDGMNRSGRARAMAFFSSLGLLIALYVVWMAWVARPVVV